MKLNRRQFEEAVIRSGLNTNGRFVLMMYASFNTYSDAPQEARPSKALVASITGIHPNTVAKYVEAAEEDGWLTPGKKYGRAQGYWLTEGVVNHPQLKPVVRGKNLPASTDDVRSDLLMVCDPSTDGVSTSTDDEELITKNNQLEEPIEEPMALADAPALPLVNTKGRMEGETEEEWKRRDFLAWRKDQIRRRGY